VQLMNEVVISGDPRSLRRVSHLSTAAEF